MRVLRKFFKNLLRNNSCVHFRIEPISRSSDLVDLMDRFVDGPLDYPLEWDDFISWKSGNAQAEEVRQRLAAHEQFLFSHNQKERLKYAELVVAERNRLAAMLGLKKRETSLGV